MTLYKNKGYVKKNNLIISNILENLNITYDEASKYKKILGKHLNTIFNPNWITIEFIRKHKNNNWDWYYLTYEVITKIGFDFIVNSSDLDWPITKNVGLLFNIPIKYILDHPTLDWNWNMICYHLPDLTIDIINDNPKLPWGYDTLNHPPDYYNPSGLRKIINKYITWKIENDMIYAEIDPIVKTKTNLWSRIEDKLNLNEQIDIEILSKHPHLTVKTIANYQKFKWIWYLVCENPNINKQELLDSNFSRDVLYVISLPYIVANPHLDWGWNYISMRSSTNLHDIINNPNLPWDWEYICENPNLTFEFIQQNISKPFRWSKISRHPNITMRHIMEYPEYPWDYKTVSENPNLTIQFILTHRDKNWDLFSLSKAKFTFDPVIYNKKLNSIVCNIPMCIQNLTININKFV